MDDGGQIEAAGSAPIDIVAERVERRATASLVPYARNSRDHDEEQIDGLMAAFRYYGFTIPVLVDEADGIIAGHGRIMAAERLAMPEVPVIVARGWSEEKIRAYVIWDNRSAEQARWNLPNLKLELKALDGAGFDLALTGFALDDLPALELSLGLPSGGGQDGDAADAGRNQGAGSLAERFGVPPFSVLNAREGWWQDRKRTWIGLGIKSELGRGEGATYGDADEITSPGLNHYRDKAKAFADGTVKGAGRGGLADQLAGSLKGAK
jgi:hypothetical protein